MKTINKDDPNQYGMFELTSYDCKMLWEVLAFYRDENDYNVNYRQCDPKPRMEWVREILETLDKDHDLG